MRDGQQILANMRDGVYGIAPEFAAIAQAGLGMAAESLQFGLSEISAEPESDGVQRTREIIDDYRRKDLV